MTLIPKRQESRKKDENLTEQSPTPRQTLREKDKNLKKGSTTREALNEVKKSIKEGLRAGRKFDIGKNIDNLTNYVKSKSKLTYTEWEKVEPKIRKEIEFALKGTIDEAQALGKKAKTAIETAFEGTAVGGIFTKFKGLGKKLKEMLGWNNKKSEKEKSSWKAAIATVLGWVGIKLGNKENSILKMLGLDFLSSNNKDKFDKFRKNIKLPKDFTLVGNYKKGKEELELTIQNKVKANVGTLKFNQKTHQITLTLKSGTHTSNKIEGINKHLTVANLKPLSATPAIATKPTQAPEIANKDKEIVDEFKKHWPNYFESKQASDLAMLKEQYGVKKSNGRIDEEKTSTIIKDIISSSAISTSKLNKLLTAIKNALSNKTFKVRLADLRLKDLSAENIAKVISVIKNPNNKYKLKKTPAQIRIFIDAINNSTDIKKTIEEQKKQLLLKK